MSKESRIATDSTEMPLHISEFQRFRRVFFARKVIVLCSVLIAGFIVAAVFAPFIAPHDPYHVQLSKSLLSPSKEYILGTDAAGRDLLSRIIYGTRISSMVGIVSVALGSIIGFAMGLFAGYFGGITNRVIMRFTDALMSIPGLVIALVIAALLGGGLVNVMIAIGISMVPISCRLMCGQALSVKENEYVTASRAIGTSNLRIMLRHVLPNCFSPLIVLMTMELGQAILAEASLSFLGIGIEPPIAAWGSMVSEGRQYLGTHPLISLAPGFAIILIVLAFNVAGDGLRDALDPRLRGTL